MDQTRRETSTAGTKYSKGSRYSSRRASSGCATALIAARRPAGLFWRPAFVQLEPVQRLVWTRPRVLDATPRRRFRCAQGTKPIIAARRVDLVAGHIAMGNSSNFTSLKPALAAGRNGSLTVPGFNSTATKRSLNACARLPPYFEHQYTGILCTSRSMPRHQCKSNASPPPMVAATTIGGRCPDEAARILTAARIAQRSGANDDR